MISQIELISVIGKAIGDVQGCPRQFNAIIKAANLILAELQIPYRPAVPGMGLEAWMQCDDVGASSLFMAGVIDGTFSRNYAWPHDADDFRRCCKMLDACGYRDRISMLEKCDEWKELVAKWDEIEALLDTDSKAATEMIREAVKCPF